MAPWIIITLCFFFFRISEKILFDVILDVFFLVFPQSLSVRLSFFFLANSVHPSSVHLLLLIHSFLSLHSVLFFLSILPVSLCFSSFCLPFFSFVFHHFVSLFSFFISILSFLHFLSLLLTLSSFVFLFYFVFSFHHHHHRQWKKPTGRRLTPGAASR